MPAKYRPEAPAVARIAGTQAAVSGYCEARGPRCEIIVSAGEIEALRKAYEAPAARISPPSELTHQS